MVSLKEIRSILAAAALLASASLASCTAREAVLETTTPVPLPVVELSPAESPAIPSAPVESPTSAPATMEGGDPYGELYFTITTPKEYFPPETPPPDFEGDYRLARLPGSCVVGLIECPEAETLPTPFDMKDVVFGSATGLAWSPDGRFGLLVTHPEDALSTGKTAEELEILKVQPPSQFEISTSTLRMFDAQTDSWSEVFSAGRKFFSRPQWSPDGEWIAFVVTNSAWTFHPLDANDGIYIVRPDGSDARLLQAGYASILGWVGDGILLQHPDGTFPSIDFGKSRLELLSLDGEVQHLFEIDRPVYFSLAPGGGALLAADAQGAAGGLSDKAVDLFALDGSLIRSFGKFSNFGSSLFPLIWSPDGALIAIANQRWVYVAPRDGQSWEGDALGYSADVREIYAADNTYVQPSFSNLQFSKDSKYLLMDVYDGVPRFVVVNLETGASAALEIKGMTEIEQASAFSWRQ